MLLLQLDDNNTTKELLTASEVNTGKSQTEALIIKASV